MLLLKGGTFVPLIWYHQSTICQNPINLTAKLFQENASAEKEKTIYVVTIESFGLFLQVGTLHLNLINKPCNLITQLYFSGKKMKKK